MIWGRIATGMSSCVLTIALLASTVSVCGQEVTPQATAPDVLDVTKNKGTTLRFVDLFIDQELWQEINAMLSLSQEQFIAASKMYERYSDSVRVMDDKAMERLGRMNSDLSIGANKDDIDTPERVELARRYHRESSILLRATDTLLRDFLDELSSMLTDGQREHLKQVMPLVRRRIAFRRSDAPNAPLSPFDMAEVIKSAQEDELSEILDLTIDLPDLGIQSVRDILQQITTDYLDAIDQELLGQFQLRRQERSTHSGRIIDGNNVDSDSLKLLREFGQAWKRKYRIAETTYSRVSSLIDSLQRDGRDFSDIQSRWRERFLTALYPSLFRVQAPDLIITKARASVTNDDLITAVEQQYAEYCNERSSIREQIVALGVQIAGSYGTTNLVRDVTHDRYVSYLSKLTSISNRYNKQMCKLLGWDLFPDAK